MSMVKTFAYPVAVHSYGGQLVRATAHGKPPLDVATPSEFRGGIEGVWSPEELLAAATASCYAVTLAAVARARRVPLVALDVSGVAHVEAKADRRLALFALELDVHVATDPGQVDAVRRAADDALRICIVSDALDVAVHADVSVAVADPQPA